MEVGVDDPDDAQAVISRIREVLGDVAARVDNHCFAGVFVTDQVRRLGQAVEIVLSEIHNRLQMSGKAAIQRLWLRLRQGVLTPVGVVARSATEQPREHRSAAGGAGVRWAAAALLLRHTGQHLLDVLTASGVAGLAAGAAGGGTAHGVSPFRGSRWSESDDPGRTRMAVNTDRCGARKAPNPTLAYTPGGIKQTDLAAFIARSWAFAHFPPSTAPEGGSDVSPPERAAVSSDLHDRNGPRFIPSPHARN